MTLKKLLFILILSLTLITVSSCQGEEKIETSAIVLSKIYETTSSSNNIIELYNPTSSTETLGNYYIGIYTNGSKNVEKKINLTGEIGPNSFYAIASSYISALAKGSNTIDCVVADDVLPFNGNDAIGLFKGNTLIDLCGWVGNSVDFNKDITFIRVGELSSFVPNKVYDEYTYIAYAVDCFAYLKNDSYEINTLEELYQGPHLEQKDFDRPFANATGSTGGGGAVKTTSLTSIADGDTASFVSPAYGGSTRYYYINTPEVNGGTVSHEPWGYVASKFNKQYLLNNYSTKEVYVQSIKGYALTETYGRHLCLVWVNDNLSQFLIVREGLTEAVTNTYSTYDAQMTYKDVPYLTFLRFAERRAKLNGWGVWGYPNKADGEKSPDWNWDTNTSTGNTNPTWTPHFAVPWAA